MKEKIGTKIQQLTNSVRRHLRIHLQKVFNRKQLGKSAFQICQLADIGYIAIITSHIAENPDRWKFRFGKEKRTTSMSLSSFASKWKSVFCAAFLLEGMGQGGNSSTLVIKMFFVDPLFSAQAIKNTFQIQYVNDSYELMFLSPNKCERFNYMCWLCRMVIFTELKCSYW